MNTVVAQARKPFHHDLRYALPRWMAGFVVITLIEQLAMFPPAGRGFWYIPNLVFFGLIEGAFGGLAFAGLQRLNPKDSRPGRIRNYLFASMIVGVGSLLAMTTIYR